jgi:hypothetical protein
MIAKIKLYVILGIIGSIIGTTVYYWKSYSLVKTKTIAQKNDSISTLKREGIVMDSLLYSMQQDIDILKSNEMKFQITISEQKKRLSEALTAEKISREAIEHYEVNGLMRYFVFDKRGLFKQGCYQEVFQKPDNICK